MAGRFRRDLRVPDPDGQSAGRKVPRKYIIICCVPWDRLRENMSRDCQKQDFYIRHSGREVRHVII